MTKGCALKKLGLDKQICDRSFARKQRLSLGQTRDTTLPSPPCRLTWVRLASRAAL
jgi:hypothetical protein